MSLYADALRPVAVSTRGAYARAERATVLPAAPVESALVLAGNLARRRLLALAAAMRQAVALADVTGDDARLYDRVCVSHARHDAIADLEDLRLASLGYSPPPPFETTAAIVSIELGYVGPEQLERLAEQARAWALSAQPERETDPAPAMEAP